MTEPQGQEGTGINPSWNDVLNYVPEDKRNEVIPKLQEWDKNYQKVQSEIAPWKDFISSGVDPETAQFSLNVLSTLEANPRMIYEALGNHLGITPGQAKELVEDQGLLEAEKQLNKQTKELDDPRLTKLQEQTDAMARILLARREEEAVAAEEAALDEELSALRDKYGEYDEEYVLAKMHAGMDSEEAVKAYIEHEEAILRRRPVAPRILGGGGQIPSPAIDPGKLDSKGTKELIVQMLQAAQAQGG